jgi:peptide/nickel transport system permease protein
MLQDAFSNIYINPAGIFWAGLIIAATVASLVLLGNAIRDGLQGPRAAALRPRATAQHGRASAAAPKVQGQDITVDNGPLLRVDDIKVGYGSAENPLTVGRGVSFDVAAGEIVGIVGESGSGKTQTAFSIRGLLPRGRRVLSGSIHFEGRDITFAPEPEMQKLRGRVTHLGGGRSALQSGARAASGQSARPTDDKPLESLRQRNSQYHPHVVVQF